MNFYNKITLNYVSINTELICLNEEEWKMMIMVFCSELAEKKHGGVLIEKLYGWLSQGYQITITNSDFDSRYIYPKVRYLDSKSILVVIPSVPYFVDVEVINSEYLEKASDEKTSVQNLIKVANYIPANFKIENSSFVDIIENKTIYKYFKLERLYPIIGFAHELIHCLRYFEGYDIDQSNEEDHTIYGIENQTLTYTIDEFELYITENSIREDFGYNPRLSHNSKEVFCYQVHSTYKNADNFTKENFFT